MRANQRIDEYAPLGLICGIGGGAIALMGRVTTPRGRSMKIASARHVCRRRVKAVFTLIVVVVFLTGCATQGDQARTEGTLAGAGIGAAVGAGLGYLIGGGQGAGIGAAVGAAVGGTSGYVYADQVAKRHEMLKGKEQDVNARIAFAEAVNSDTRQYNQRLQQQVAELEPKIASLEARVKTQQVTRQELDRQKQALTQRIDDANKQLVAGQNELQELKNFRARQSSSSPKLDAQISALEANLVEMRSHTTSLASQSSRI